MQNLAITFATVICEVNTLLTSENYFYPIASGSYATTIFRHLYASVRCPFLKICIFLFTALLSQSVYDAIR